MVACGLLASLPAACRDRPVPIVVEAEARPAPGTADSLVGGQEPGDSVVVVAVGDVVCGTETPEGIPCLHARNAALVRQLQPAALLLLGDLQYEKGSHDDFGAFFEPTFGQFKAIIRPVPGNHEYFTPGAAGYFDYFNGAGNDSGPAGHRRRGYYSFNLGAWHVVALNSNCDDVGGCGTRSPQATWLREDLASNRARCTLAYWHNARFSSGAHGDDRSMADLWPILQQFDVDVVVSGHDHDYERLAPLDARGRVDSLTGIRSFVVGTGGKGLGRFGRARTGSQVRDNSAIGVLQLTLRASSMEWRFVSAPGFTFADSGRAPCREGATQPGAGSGD